MFDVSDAALLKQSYQAFVNYNNTHQCDSNRTASILNGIIVTDSESDDPDQYIALDMSIAHAGTSFYRKKKRKAIRCRAQYLISNTIANRNFLQRKRSTHSITIIKQFPTIGKEIKDYVKSCNVGADAWRHTGVLIFDGNL